MITGLEPFLVKLLSAGAGPLVGPVAKKAKTRLFGEAHVNALKRLAEDTLARVVTDGVEPLGLTSLEAGHVRDVLERALNELDSTEIFPRVAAEDRSTVLRLGILQSDTVDLMSLTFARDTDVICVDCVPILEDFLRTLRARLTAAAQSHDSNLFEFVTQERLSAIDGQLEAHRMLLREMAAAATRTPSADAAARRAAEVMRRATDRRINEDIGHDEFVESASVAEWAAYECASTWRSAVDDHLRHLLGYEPLKRRRGDVSWRVFDDSAIATYPTVRRWLREIEWDSVLADLDEIGADVLRATVSPDTAAHIAAHRAVVSAARWLRREAASPSYRFCLGLLGSWGSGKSRLLTEIARGLRSAGGYTVFPTLHPNRRLEYDVLDSANYLFGTTFSDLDDLNRFLDATLACDLYVLVDDVDDYIRTRPAARAELHELLEDATEFGRLRWVLTADDAGYDDVVLASRPEFWSEYGFSSGHEADKAGWLDLDSTNLTGNVGLRLLEQRAEMPSAAQFAADSETFEYEHRVLSNPMAAWLWADRLATGGPDVARLADLNQRDFVAAYWAKRRATLGSSEADLVALDQAITILARHYVTGGNTERSMQSLVRIIRDEASAAPLGEDDQTARGALDLLRAAGLLRCWLPKGDPEVDILTEQAAPQFPTFWGYRIAKPLVRETSVAADAPDQFTTAIDPWTAAAGRHDALASAVCQFALAMLDWNDPSTKPTRRIWSAWLDSDKPMAPAWLGALTGPQQARSAVVSWLKHGTVIASHKRETFALLRFAQLPDLPSWKAPARLRLLQPHYDRIGQHGLGSYASAVIRTVLDDRELCGDRNYVSVLKALVGIEAAGAARAAAQCAVHVGQDIFDDNRPDWLRRLVTFFAQTDRLGASATRPRSEQGRYEQDLRHTDTQTPQYFWEHLAHEATQHVVGTSGLDAFDELRGANWFNADTVNVSKTVALRLRIEANLAIGSWYQRHRSQKTAVDRYVQLVQDLADGRVSVLTPIDQREIAFFLIRHSRVTGGRPRVKVDAAFHPALRELCRDRALRGRVALLRPMCEANGVAELTD